MIIFVKLEWSNVEQEISTVGKRGPVDKITKHVRAEPAQADAGPVRGDVR